jgi:Rrf2 family protein
MKISTRSRYGLRLLIELSRHRGTQPLDLKAIASRQGISEKYLSKLVIPLRGAGLISSERGTRGGYRLAKPPKEISLKDVIETLEGGFSLIDCVSAGDACPRSSDCTARSAWMGLERAMKDYCAALRLSDMAEGEASPSYADYI